MKKILLTVAAISLVFSMMACSGAASPEPAVTATEAVTATGDEAAAMAADINRRYLNALVIDEFPYMSAKKPGMVDQVRTVRRSINEATPLVPADYKIVIYGHNDSNEGRSGIGLQRARQVYYELRGLGSDVSKMRTKSAANTEMTSVEGESHPKQRRVTFKCELAR